MYVKCWVMAVVQVCRVLGNGSGTCMSSVG